MNQLSYDHRRRLRQEDPDCALPCCYQVPGEGCPDDATYFVLRQGADTAPWQATADVPPWRASHGDVPPFCEAHALDVADARNRKATPTRAVPKAKKKGRTTAASQDHGGAQTPREETA
jgi:hypothetical protein